MKHYNQFGIWVSQQLIGLGWEKQDLAKKLGVSKCYLSDVLAGRKPGAKYLDPIIEIIQVAKDEQVKEHNLLKEVV